MIRSRAALVGLALAALCVHSVSCKKGDDAAGPSSTHGPVPAPAIPPPPPAPEAQKPLFVDGGTNTEAILDPNKAGDWIARTVTPALEQEAKSRPQGAVKAEDVLAAIEKKGLKLQGKNQALGSIVGASYCLSADTEKMTGVLVCEYFDEAAAQKGSQLTKQLYGLALPMEVYLKGKTALAITSADKSAAVVAEVRAIAEAFKSL